MYPGSMHTHRLTEFCAMLDAICAKPFHIFSCLFVLAIDNLAMQNRSCLHIPRANIVTLTLSFHPLVTFGSVKSGAGSQLNSFQR